MQKIITIAVVFLCTCSTGFAQSKAPMAVTMAFNQRFPTATKVQWAKENKHEYEANFAIGGKSHSANYSDTGEWLETESPTTFKQIPPKVQEAFNNRHTGSKIKAVAQIETSTGKTNYEIEFEKGKKTLEVFFDENGKEIKM